MNIQAILDDKGSDVQVVRPDADATVATNLMVTYRIAALVVTDHGRVVGLLGERELVEAMASSGGTIIGLKVRDVMRPHPETCSPADAIDEVMGTMTRRRRRHLPVVDASGLCGIVSIGDMVKFRLNQVELESRVLRDAYLSRH
ncbi:MAG: CBS domain-containing protein [Acidimicrobiales bacterium]